MAGGLTMNIENVKKTYKSENFITYSCQYHVIFCTKYGRDVLLGDIGKRMGEIIYEISKSYGFDILDVNIMPNYVHLLIDCNPKPGIAECVKKIKHCSSHQLKEEFPSLKSRLPSLWTRNVFISTAGEVSLPEIQNYIKEQKIYR